MAGDRDVGVAVLRAWTRRAPDPARSGWEMLAATGARGLRLVGETHALATLLLTEANPEAYRVLVRNGEGRPGVTFADRDARTNPPGGPFGYVDLDPYGSPAPFVRVALDAVRPGGLLAVTATDMMVLAGAQPAACVRRYGARPVRGRLGPEGGLRILLAYLARSAAERGRSVRPVLAYVRDHHVRAYVEVRDGVVPAPIDTIVSDSWTGPPLGDSGPWGPLWLGPIHDPELAEGLEVPDTAAQPREVGTFLARIAEEARIDRPFYYEPNTLARRLGIPRPSPLESWVERLRASGFRAGRTHVRPEGFRTDAPRAVVEATARELAAD